jgi:3-deoxy-7-phosphoheptulonate synthase
MLMIVGPCSIHDPKAGMEYARCLAILAKEVQDRILIAMRVYFEKPRTTVGWKGYINDPNLNGTYDVKSGMAKAREFLLQVCEVGLAAATEFLEPFTPQYLGDLVAWGAIGARTTESQTHRLIASGLSMPIGFKNGTGGTVQIAVDGIVAARSEHVFLGIDDSGVASIVKTSGNPAGHLVLRGGKPGPNYDARSVASAQRMLEESGLKPHLIVDCSHDNSGKDHRRQPIVFEDIMRQRVRGNQGIVGLMLESHLHEGNQTLGDDPSKLAYGTSITDACIGWEQTEDLVRGAFAALGD